MLLVINNYMALGSIKNAREVFQQHDFSRSWQIRLLNMSNVPDYVYRELIEKPAGLGGHVYAKTLSVPGREIQNIEVPYQGFPINIQGMARYTPNPWSITFRTPGDYLVRNALERWSFATISDETSCGTGFPCDNTTIDLAILAPNCDIMRVYRLHGVYPQNVGQITYNIEGNDLTEFEVAFQYQYWRVAHAYETGVLDSNAGAQQEIDNVFQAYEAKILTGTGGSCPPVNIPQR
jgi:hypothetical protein